MASARDATATTDWFQLVQDPSLSTRMQMVDRVRRGVPWADFSSALVHLDLTLKDGARLLHLSQRTLDRRKKGALDPQEGERFLRLLRIWDLAHNVLGAHDKALRWLHRENRALGGTVPLSLLDTDIGTQAVEDVLGRIEHGVFS